MGSNRNPSLPKDRKEHQTSKSQVLMALIQPIRILEREVADNLTTHTPT
jgi:hypothetical protein